MDTQSRSRTRNAEEITAASPVEEIRRQSVHMEHILNALDYEPDPLEVHFGRALPAQLIRRYARLAAMRADAEELEDGTWFASIRGFQGVWAQGDSEEEALETIESVLLDWTCFKIVDKDRDLPVIDGIDLNVI